MQSRKIVILQPTATKPEELEELKENRPFIMRGSLPNHAQFIQLLAIPTIIDMLGMTTGGGPPGFAYSINPHSPGEDHYLWFMIGPGLPVEIPGGDDGVYGRVLGVTSCLGMLLGAVEMKGPKEAIVGVTDMFKAAGSMVFDMAPYKIPEMMRQRAFPHATQKPSL